VIAQQGREVLYKYDLQNRFTYVSPQYHTLLGYGPEDFRLERNRLLTDIRSTRPRWS